MAPNTGASAPFLEQVVAGVGTDTKCTQKMVPNTSGCTERRRHAGSISRHTKREVATRTGARCVSWDGHVRVAKIQVGNGTLTRPVTKLCPLELEL